MFCWTIKKRKDEFYSGIFTDWEGYLLWQKLYGLEKGIREKMLITASKLNYKLEGIIVESQLFG